MASVWNYSLLLAGMMLSGLAVAEAAGATPSEPEMERAAPRSAVEETQSLLKPETSLHVPLAVSELARLPLSASSDCEPVNSLPPSTPTPPSELLCTPKLEIEQRTPFENGCVRGRLPEGERDSSAVATAGAKLCSSRPDDRALGIPQNSNEASAKATSLTGLPSEKVTLRPQDSDPSHPPATQRAQIPLPVIPEGPPPPTFDFNNPPPPPTFNPQQPPPTSPAPEQFNFDYYNTFSRYRLGIGDNLVVQVAGFPEFDARGTINIEGNFVVPILGNVPAIGLTLEELSAKISFQLGQQFLFQRPEVTSTLANARPATITVLGEVVRPGFYNLVPGAEVDEAIVAAGGSRDLADLRTVVVRRSLVDGTILERQVNVFQSLQNGTRLPPLRLQDGDSVFVPKVEVGQLQDYDRRLVSRSTIAQQQIVVNILSYANEAVGALTLANGSTFVDAIAQLGLNFENADLDSIGLLRFDPEQGKVVSQSLNALAAIEGDLSQNVPLQDGDIFIVRRSTFAKIDYVLRTISRPINSVTGLFDFIRNTLIDTLPNLFRGGGGR